MGGLEIIPFIYLFALHVLFANYLLAMVDVVLVLLFSIGILKSWEDKTCQPSLIHA